MHHHTPTLLQALIAVAIFFGVAWGIHLALHHLRDGDEDDRTKRD